MTRFGSIDFDDRVLDALRDDKLVIFAGAGVSMGTPSNLASFVDLARGIAKGTGYEPIEPLDRFLGQLHHRKVFVHERAAELLSPVDSEPTVLHQDLLRLFGTAERVRLVTTNFDLHFEKAAGELFGSAPDVYRAPALPLGYNFTGIVHVHGALPHARDLVLTDADFGRAYLTEGWARRFLVDVFRHFTVLFVGYRHNDVVMNYLARALPAGGVVGRFVLTDEIGDGWDLLGIIPIYFTKRSDDDSYHELHDGVHRLAERTSRGFIDWKNRIELIAKCPPPVDEETVSEINQALRDVYTTRFFANVARDPEWIRWLDTHKHLDALFGAIDLNERDLILCRWIAEHFAVLYPGAVFELIAKNGVRLNREFWKCIGNELGKNKGKQIGGSDLKRWVTILLASASKEVDCHVLTRLAECCASHNVVSLALRVFLTMAENRLLVKSGLQWSDESDHVYGPRVRADYTLHSDHWSLNKIWVECIKPSLSSVAQPLLSGIVINLEGIFGTLVAWGEASREWDPVSYFRAAIEPHEQDKYPKAVDVLIDAARDALEWLAVNAPVLLDAWIERLLISDAPLLRRLAIHAFTEHTDRSADCSLQWLLDRVGLHDSSVHHEVHRAVALNYAAAGERARQAVVDAIVAHQLPEGYNLTAEQRTDRSHFEWLSWLLRSKIDCALAQAALAPIKDTYPDWRPSVHPDLTHWTNLEDWEGAKSPLSIEQLLARTPREQLDELLNFQGKRIDEPSREGLLSNIREACKMNTSWAFELSDLLVEKLLWESDLWSAVIWGLKDAEVSSDDLRRTLQVINAKADLLVCHAYDISLLLYSLVNDGGKKLTLELLDQANEAALRLWNVLQPSPNDDCNDDWVSLGFNRAPGVIVQFWINGLSLFVHSQKGAERTVPDNYRQWFTMVVQDETSNGDFGRSILASQTKFLFDLDKSWALQHLIPLFGSADRNRFLQVWSGFLLRAQLSPGLIDAMMPASIAATQRLSGFPSKLRRRFVEYFTMFVVFYSVDPMESLLPAFFKHGGIEDRTGFAASLCRFLCQMEAGNKKKIWEAWLHRYWLERLQGVPTSLCDEEICEMLEWLPYLDEVFAEACSVVVRANVVQVEFCHLLRRLRDSELVARYPESTAELLIYLCKCVGESCVDDLRLVAKRLSSLEPSLRSSLDEAMARFG